MSNYLGVHHVSFLVKDTQRSLLFYCGVLGFEVIERPELSFPGAWLAVGAQQIHLLELPNPDPVIGRPEHGGRDRHCAILTKKIPDLTDLLTQAGLDYSVSKSGRNALFCRDPDGNGLEFIAS